MIDLFMVYESGTIALLPELSIDQAGHMVQMYPRLHIFYTEDGLT